MKRAVTAAVLALLLLLPAASLIGRGAFKPPPKFIVLFGLLLVAATALKLRLLWLRFPILAASVAYLGFYEGSCACPNGALQNLFVFMGTSAWARMAMPLLEVAGVLAVVFLFGNIYCGWVCQKGGVQEFLFRPNMARRIPRPVDRTLRSLPWLMLAAMILYPFLAKRSFFSAIDPFKVAFNLEGPLAIVLLLGVTLAASLFVFRPFCRYFCPFGVLAGVVHSLGLFRLSFAGDCSGCRRCERSCPAGALHLDSRNRPQMNPSRCLACRDCAVACPKLPE